MDDASQSQSLLTEVTQLKAQLAQRDQLITTLTRQRDEFYLEKLRLEVRLAQALKQAYGPRADRIGDPAQLVLDFARQLEAQPIPPEDQPSTEAHLPADASTARRLRTRGRRDIGTLDHLPMIEKTYELTGDLCRCPSCQQQRSSIGTEVSYTIEHIPASLLRIKHIQHKYACRACEQNGHNPNIERAAKRDASPIDKGLAGPGLLAYIATAKFADYLPLHRLEAIFARDGFELDRSTMCLWMADVARIARPVYDRMAQRVRQCAALLRPLHELMIRQVRASKVIHTDDTPVEVLEPGRGQTRTGRFWVYVGDANHPFTVFTYTPSRSRDGPREFLNGWSGFLQADAFGGYDGIYAGQAGGQVTEVACWAHARRKFYEARTSDAALSTQALAYIRLLYDVEDEAKKRFQQAAKDRRGAPSDSGDQTAIRNERLVARRVKAAGFREQKTLEDFDWHFNPSIKRKPLFDLATGRFIREARDLLLIGPPGTGKSHLAQALGHQAIKSGFVVLYRSIFDLVRDFLHDEALAGQDKTLDRYLRPDLVIIDDMGMKQLPKRSGEYLFEIIMRRYQVRSTLMTSNRPLEDWGKLIGDVPAATAILDRFLHNAEVIAITGKSYRLKDRGGKSTLANEKIQESDCEITKK